MSRKICKGSVESEEVAHYVISQFLENPKAQHLVEAGEAMSYLSGAIWRSFNSSTSPYHKVYRQSGRVFGLPDYYDAEDLRPEYSLEQDALVEEINGILTDLEYESIETWYMATLFKMHQNGENYSAISRNTGIPRTSVSTAVQQCANYIKQQLINRNILWNS